MEIIASNKKANYDYFINQKIEAGIVLSGSEVKSLRINTGSIKESFIIEKEGEIWLKNCHIKKYDSSNELNYEATRERKILVNKKQLNQIIGFVRRDGMTIIQFLVIIFFTITAYLSIYSVRYCKNNCE